MPFCFYTHVGMAYNILFVWNCLYIVIICASGNTKAQIEIKRERYDKFIPQSLYLERRKSKQKAGNLCKSFKAECENDECKYCQCIEEDSNTFLLLTPTTGNCTKDQDIIRDSVPNGNFFLQNGNKAYGCLTATGNRTVSGTKCSSSLNMRWIWLNETGEIQLMNVMTLQCLEFVKSSLTCSDEKGSVKHLVVMNQCDRTNRQQQITQPKTKTHFIYTKMCVGERKFYLEIDEHSKKAISKSLSTGQFWKNRNDGQLLRKTITYRGCYRFQNQNFMLYLDKDVCSTKPCTRNFSAPIFSENSQCSIIWSKSTIMRSDIMWQEITKMTDTNPIFIENVSKDLKMLMIKEESFEIFNNSLLKLAISCKNKTHQSKGENHCLLLKFKTWVEHNRTTKKNTEITVILPTTRAKVANTTVILKPGTGEKSVLVAAVATLVSELIIVLMLVVAYFYRKRFVKNSERGNSVTDQNSSPVVEELPEMRNLSNNQATPIESEIYVIPRAEQEYLYENTNQRISCAQSQGPEYENPGSPKYESPEIHPNHQYEYPSLGATGKKDVGVKDGEYFPLRRPLFKDNEDDLSGYTSLLKLNSSQGHKEAT